jgi:hypothetical protein
MSEQAPETKMFQIVLPEDVTLKEVAAYLNLMTVTMEVDAGDPVADAFVKDNPRLVVDITVAHGQAQDILGAFDETAKEDAS